MSTIDLAAVTSRRSPTSSASAGSAKPVSELPIRDLAAPANSDLDPRQRRAHARRRLRRELPRDARHGFAFAALFSVGLNLLQLALPIYSMQVYDRVLPSGSSATLIALSALTCLFVVSGAVLDAVRTQVLVRLGNTFEAHWRERLLPIALNPAVPGVSAHGVLRDLDLLRGFLTGSMLTALLDLPWSVLFIVAIAILAPTLGGITLVAAIALLAITFLAEVLSRRATTEARAQAHESQILYEASVADRDTLRAMGGVEVMRRRVDAARGRAMAGSSRALDILAWTGASSRGLRSAFQILVLMAATALVLADEAAAGVIVASSMLFGRALAPFERVASGWRSVQAAREAADRLAGLLAEAPNATRRMSLPALKGRLEVGALGGRHAPHAAVGLENVSFDLAPGQVLAVIGTSGAGKSILSRLLVGALRPSAGTVRLDGAALDDWDPDELGRQVGFLPQEPKLFDGTVAELIARCGPIDDAQVVKAAQRAGAHEFILRLPHGYQTVVGGNGHGISLGERQRIALAQALYGKPAFVVLDEPTAGLDEQGEQQLLTTILELKRTGTTVVFVSRCVALLQVADNVLVLERGQVCMYKPRAEIDGYLGRRHAAQRGDAGISRLARSA